MVNYFLNYFFLTFLSSLAISNNLILFFISWVGLNVSLYGILLRGFNSYNIEIVLKYFLSGAIITALLLLSISFFYLEFFTFNFDSVSYIFLNSDSSLINSVDKFRISNLQKLFFLLTISIFLFKLGAFPFHFYLGDIYEALDFKKTMFLYTIPLKLIIFFTLLKFLTNFWFIGLSLFDLIMCSGVGSLFISSFTALTQVKLKRFWAYSYLNSIGFSLISVASGVGSNFGEITFYTAKLYFLVYLITWCGIFEIFVSFATRYRKRAEELFYITDLLYIRNTTNFEYLNNIKNNNMLLFPNFRNTNLCQISFFIFILSLMGLPPTLGFFSKMLVYVDLASSKNTIMYLILILFLTPVMSLAYLKLIVYLIFPTKLRKSKIFIYLNSNVGGGKIIEKKELEVQKIFKHSFDSWRNKVSCINLVDVAIIIFFSPVIIFLVHILDLNKIIYNLYIFEIKLLNEVQISTKYNLMDFFIYYLEMSQKLYYPITSYCLDGNSYLKKYDTSFFLFSRSKKEDWENFLFFKNLNLKHINVF